jgi:hypothetical protein
MLEIMLLNACLVVGINVLFQPGMILSRVGDRIVLFALRKESLFDPEPNKPRAWLVFLLKPLFQCAPCMCSIWSAAGFWATELHWTLYPVYAITIIPFVVVLKSFWRT